MRIELKAEFASTLPIDDEHPYRTGPWRPNVREYDAFDLPVTGELPADLNGVYLRNTENPLQPAIGRYHPFDGDGMLHAVSFSDGSVAYRNRFVRTDGLAAETEAGRPLWAGLMESPERSERDGWGARTRMKDASSTDVVVHGGKALTSFYQCGDLYEMDPATLAPLGKASWVNEIARPWGVSAHPKVDEATGELLFFSYAKEAPYLNYGLVDAQRHLVHEQAVPLPGPRLPHDMAFTRNYAILNDLPLFWDPKALEKGAHAPRFFPDLPSRFAILPRRGGEVRWFEAKPTYVLHWINAFEDGDEIVLDGFFQDDPLPGSPRSGAPPSRAAPDRSDPLFPFRMLDVHALQTRPYRWRFNLTTGATREGYLSDGIAEFAMINPDRAGEPYRYAWMMLGKPDWFLFNGLQRLDVETGQTESYRFPDGVFASETPMAPAARADAEDDGYVVTLVTDMNRDESRALVFRADELARGPVASVVLPERVSSGTHAFWARS